MTCYEVYDKFFADEACDLKKSSAYEYSYWVGWNNGLKRAAILISDEVRPKGEWKLVYDINNDIDVVCPFCNERRIISYAHGYSIEEVKSQLQEVNNLPNYCENCGAFMKKGSA